MFPDSCEQASQHRGGDWNTEDQGRVWPRPVLDNWEVRPWAGAAAGDWRAWNLVTGYSKCHHYYISIYIELYLFWKRKFDDFSKSFSTFRLFKKLSFISEVISQWESLLLLKT